MKLYYSRGACSLAVRIIIHEMSLSCEYESVDLKTKKTEKGTDFFQINPKGAVPVLVLDNQQILTENAVIHQYLADTHKATKLLPAVGDFMRYRVLEWLNFISTDLHKGCSPLFNSKVPEDAKNDIFKPILMGKLAIVDHHLNKNKYLMGEQFTLPDAYLFIILRWLPHFKIDISGWPNLSRYFSELKNRQSIKIALKEESITA